MRIGIDTLFENPTIGTGGLTYIQNLVHCLADLDDENEYVLYVSPQNRSLFNVERPNVRQALCPFSKERRLGTIAFEHTALPVLARRHLLDVFHAPGNVAPVWLPCASVVTVHTLHHWLLPELLPRESRVYRRLFMARSVRRAEIVIAVSGYVKEKLVELLHVRPAKIRTIHLGATSPAEPDGVPNAGPASFPRGSILFVSALWPYKNAETAIRALARLRQSDPAGPKLVLVGSGFAWYEGELRALAEKEGVADGVVFAGHVPQRYMAGVYQRASVLVYPSLEEYFGLPPLEAMAAGVPVVASDRSSIPEIVGDAGLLVPPTDAGAMADAIARVLRDERLRKYLVARGKERIRAFTWERMARETLAAYGAAVERRRLAALPGDGG